MILDTNALSAFFDGAPTLVRKLSEAPALYLPVIVIGEYRFGLKASRFRREREKVLREFSKICTVLPILESSAWPYARIRHDLRAAGTPIPQNDIWIAALALEYDLTVISRDAHFKAVKAIKVFSW